MLLHVYFILLTHFHSTIPSDQASQGGDPGDPDQVEKQSKY